MKRHTFFALLLGGLTFSTAVFAQKPQRVLDTQNMREGENVEYCVTHKKHAALLQNSAYVKGLAIAEAEYAEVAKKGNDQKGTIYTIPVVFHVLHFNGVENISDEQILNALAFSTATTASKMPTQPMFIQTSKACLRTSKSSSSWLP